MSAGGAAPAWNAVRFACDQLEKFKRRQARNSAVGYFILSDGAKARA